MAYESIPIEKINFNGPIDMGTNIMFGYLSDTDRIVDANNVKKQFRFDCVSLTAGTLRTYTAPDASGTIALTSDISYPVTSVFGRTGAVVAAQNDYTFAQLASKPTTLSGYGITDAQGLDSDLTTIAGLTATTDNFIVSVASAWASRTPAQVKTTLGLGTIATLNSPLPIANGGTGADVNTAAGGFIYVKSVGGNVFFCSPAAVADSIIRCDAADYPRYYTDLPTAVTIGSAYIYRASGTDVSVADGGTGKSSATLNSYLKGNGTSALIERTYSEVRTDLALVIGTDVQAYDVAIQTHITGTGSPHTAAGVGAEAANANIQAHIANNTQAHSDYLLNTGDTASGNYAFDTDTFYIDATNNRVGIGTGVPGYPLHVLGGSLGTTAGNNLDISFQGGTTINGVGLRTRLYRTSGGSDWTTAALLLMRITDSTEQAYISLFGSNVGIGTATPDVALDINGFTQLGSDAPKIKMKKLTGTTAAAEGGGVSITHGLTSTKIIAIQVMVEYSSGSYVPSSYTNSAGYQYDWYADATNVTVGNHATNSENILSKPIKVLITYEE